MDMSGFIFIACGLTAVALLFIMERKRADKIIRNWAQANNYILIEADKRLFKQGPYLGKASRYHAVMYVKLMDDKGNQREAYVKFYNGIFTSSKNIKNLDITWMQ